MSRNRKLALAVGIALFAGVAGLAMAIMFPGVRHSVHRDESSGGAAAAVVASVAAVAASRRRKKKEGEGRDA